MKFCCGNKLIKSTYFLWEIVSQTIIELEGPEGDFAKMTFTVPS